jgi:predicted permease
MRNLWLDVRTGLKALRHGRGVSWLAVLAFALGIGITTAVFTLYYGVLIKPMPFPSPDQLVIVYDTQPSCTTCPASYPKYMDWTERNAVFSALGGSATGQAVITGDGDPERVPVATVTATLVNDVFKVAPQLGRWFTNEENAAGGPKVAVLSSALWRRRYGADPNIVGRTIVVEGQPTDVVGVMPESFAHRRAEIFLPLQRVLDPSTRGNHFLLTYGRMKPGVTLERAQRDMVALGGTLAKEFGHNHGISVQSYYRAVVGSVEDPLRQLMVGVVLVLLIASANVANLLLTAGITRRRELAVRSALGATRWDLARQLTVESVCLALAGGAIGLLLAQWAVRTFVTLGASILPRSATLGIDWWVIGFAVGVSIVTGVFCGLWPVIRLRARTLAASVREGDQRGGADAASRLFGNGLVVAEIALAFTLLVSAGLLLKNLLGLEARETGFKSESIVTFDLQPSGPRYADNGVVRQFYRDLLARLATVPGVERVGATSHLPMYQFGWNGEVTLESGNPWPDNQAPLVENRWIAGDYFAAMGIDLVRGRVFDATDRDGAPLRAVISARAAQTFWPGQDPIGRRFYRGGRSADNPLWEVIGVVGDVRSYGLESNSPFEMYATIEQAPFNSLTIVMRTTGDDPTGVMPAARAIVRAADAQLPLARVQTMTQVVAESVNQPRLISALALLFGILGGLLAAVGVYGVMAYNVRRERREFGVRLALGADPRKVRMLIVRRGLGLGLLGVVLGALGAFWMSTWVGALLADVEPTDPTVFGAAAALLLGVAFISVYLPARSASKTDPMIALRGE